MTGRLVRVKVGGKYRPGLLIREIKFLFWVVQCHKSPFGIDHGKDGSL